MSYSLIILTAAKAAKVSGALLLAICMNESNLKNIQVPHDGGSTSFGICQIKKGTAEMLGYTGNDKGLMDPKVNAYWAAQYLKYQQKRYNQNLCMAVSAYNAGRYNESAILPGYPRNLKYVRRVQKNMEPHLQYKLSCATNKKLGELALGSK